MRIDRKNITSKTPAILKNAIQRYRKAKIAKKVYTDFKELVEVKAPSEDAIHLHRTMDWLCLAQDKSGCGGVSALYNLEKKSWGNPYRETTGYIIETFLNYSKSTGQKKYLERALQMGEWELEEQLIDGSYGEETKDGSIRKKIFNTGQVMLGLFSLYDQINDVRYLNAARKAGDWLISNQEANGSWVNFTTAGPKTYHARVAWPLLELYKRTGEDKYRAGAVKNLNWVLSQQEKNGWFRNCSLSEPERPWTHLIAYTVRGVLESSLILENSEMFDTARLAAEKMLEFYEQKRVFPGTFDSKWQSKDNYSCLTGNVQTAIIWLKIYERTKEKRFRIGAEDIINDVKITQKIDSPIPEIRGAIAGSYPIEGDYASFAMLNWAAKFFADALMFKMDSSLSPKA